MDNVNNNKTSPVELSAGIEKTEKKRAFSTISLPKPLIDRISEIVNEFGYWPTKTAFVREASLEKLEKHWKEKRVQRR